MPNSGNGGDTTLAIIASTSILGFLLLLVMITLMVLICVVLFKKKKTESYRTHSSERRNTYVTAEANQGPKGEVDDSKNRKLVDSGRPKLPSDPEYATISEWRQMTGVSTNRTPSVTNPFYASSQSLATKSKAIVDSSPRYMEVVDDSGREQGMGRNLLHSRTAYSLQDVRSTSLKDEHTQNRAAAIQRVQMHHTNSSPRNLPPRSATVGRNTSLKDSLNSKPVPPPRPVMVQRNASMKVLGSVEPYLLSHVQAQQAIASGFASPLMQSRRSENPQAAGKVSKKGQDERGGSDDDVGNDNYIILSHK